MGQTYSSRADSYDEDSEYDMSMEPDVNNTVESRTKYDAGCGLFAATNVAAGDVIIRQNNPVYSLLQESAFPQRCAYCFQETSKSLKCTGCMVVHYCNKQCQTLAWKIDHRYECKHFRSTMEKRGRVLPTSTRLLMLIMLRIESESSKPPAWSKNLVSHREAFIVETEANESAHLQARMALKLAKLPLVLMELAMTIYFQLKVNAFRLNAADDTAIGVCFDPLLARANHSCLPNAFLSFDGRITTLRALHPIKASEEVLISYIDPTQPTFERQNQLQSRYKFVCSCLRCTQDLSVYDVLFRLPDSICRAIDCSYPSIAELKRHVKYIDSDIMKQQQDIYGDKKPNPTADVKSQRKNLARLLIELRRCGQVRPVAHYPYPDILHLLYDSYLETQEYAAATIIRIVLACHVEPFQFPEICHPARVASIFALAKLVHLTSEDPEHALVSLNVINSSHLRAFKPLPTVLSLLLLIQGNVKKSHGLETQFAREIADEVLQAAKAVHLLAQTGRDSTGLTMLDDGFNPGSPGRSVAKALWEELACLADLEQVMLLTLTPRHGLDQR